MIRAARATLRNVLSVHCRSKTVLRVLRCAAALTAGSVLSSAAAEKGNSSAKDSTDDLDISKLSLEQLLQAEITPINVLGSHTHLGGEIMFGYRYSVQDWHGNLSGSRQVSSDEVLRRYNLYHSFMTTEMHMFELMYAPTDKLTLMAMAQYMDMSMGHIRANGSTFTSVSSGIGDTELMALYNVLGDSRGGAHRLAINAGVSLPTGSIDEKFNGSALEYSMQLGSGTFDLLPGLTYLGQSESFSWGAQALGRIRVGENSRNYKLGNAYQLGGWVHYKLRDWIGPSLRLEWRQWADIRGIDHALDPMHNPAFDPDLQSGRRLDLLGGINLYASRGLLKGFRLSAEAGVPVYQHIDGPNLELDWMVNVGVSYVFR